MEVHKHSQHVTHKKKWGEYLLEFLMLFLAVTLGFFAENMRENYKDHEKARIYAAQMISNLCDDTLNLRPYISLLNSAAGKADTLLQLVTTADPQKVSGKLYWYGMIGGRDFTFIPNDATWVQMKSSGTLRYFNTKMSHDLAQYDQFCRRQEITQNNDRGLFVEVRKIRAQIFIVSYNDFVNKHYRSQMIDSFVRTNPPLLTYDKAILNQYVELVRSRLALLTTQHVADTLLLRATDLIRNLKEEYDIK
jgi:hypothetical protein